MLVRISSKIRYTIDRNPYEDHTRRNSAGWATAIDLTNASRSMLIQFNWCVVWEIVRDPSHTLTRTKKQDTEITTQGKPFFSTSKSMDLSLIWIKKIRAQGLPLCVAMDGSEGKYLRNVGMSNQLFCIFGSRTITKRANSGTREYLRTYRQTGRISDWILFYVICWRDKLRKVLRFRGKIKCWCIFRLMNNNGLTHFARFIIRNFLFKCS